MSDVYYISTIKGTTRYYLATTKPNSGSDYYVQLINPLEETKRVPSKLYFEGNSKYSIYTIAEEKKFYLNQTGVNNPYDVCLNFSSGNVYGKDFWLFEDDPNTNTIQQVDDIKLNIPLYFKRDRNDNPFYLSNDTCNILKSHIKQSIISHNLHLIQKYINSIYQQNIDNYLLNFTMVKTTNIYFKYICKLELTL